MAQFRTIQDISDEVLQKSGEPTNGNSPYEATVLTYLNKVHHAIIAGGNIFSTKVDEPWTWARAKYPIVLELEPAITTDTVTVTNGDINITFLTAPTQSVEGWHFQLVGRKTVYKISQHTSSITSAVLDSSVIEESGTYNYRLFKLDYEIFPAYLYVDSWNDRIDFEEAADTPLSATLTHGSYTPTTLINHVVTKLNAAGAATYTGSYDSVLKQFTITSDLSGGAIFTLLGATGTSKRRSALPLLGLDRLDHSGAAAYTSAYIVNGIARLIEPFRVFTQESNNPFIKSTDPINLELDYPIALTEEVLPSHFAQVSEDNEGTITVRFNSYPRDTAKVLIDWTPVPIDLQDNAASFPLIPRKDIDVLIHGASSFILFDKEDSKWEQMYGLCKTGLESMEKKNRSELFRTGPEFAQIIPRADLLNRPRKLRYGYTVDGGASAAAVNETAQSMIKVTLSYTDFQTASTTKTVTARTLPSNRTLFALIVKHSTAFAGGAISAITIDVGITTDTDKFIAAFDIFQAVSDSAQESALLLYYPAAATNITVKATATGANLSALTAGSLDVYFQESIVG